VKKNKSFFEEEFDFNTSFLPNDTKNHTKIYIFTPYDSFYPSYVGITGRDLEERAKEHERSGRFKQSEGEVKQIAEFKNRDEALALERQMISNGKKAGSYKLNIK
jgi:predicted GIY-YIG superfamily endonuclease